MKVLLTRSTDVYISPEQRATLANKAKVDLFVSFHENSAQNKSARGYEDYRSGTAGNATKSAHAAFHAVAAAFFKAHNVQNRGTKTAAYAVLRYTNMPALLIEHLFISNAADLKLQTDAAFTKAAAKMYADAIRAAMKAIGKPNGVVMLDAGHGGKDPGAVNGKEHEAAHMLKLVTLIKNELDGTAVAEQPQKPNVSTKIGYDNTDGANAFRLQSGKYSELEAAQAAAEKLIANGSMNYVTVVGYKE